MVIVGLAAVVVPLVPAVTRPAYAAGTTRYVATNASNATDADNDCSDAAVPCKTIANAVDQANAGDTISVAAGTYYESEILRQSLTITGAGASGTTIVGNGGDSGVVADGTDTLTRPVVTLSNLAISNNTASSGLEIDAADVTMTGVAVSDNAQNGIDIGEGGTVHVTGSQVSGNTGAGIFLGSGSAVVTRSLLSHNGTGAINNDGDATTSVEVSESTLAGNIGAGVILDAGGSVDLERTTISGTTAFSDAMGDPFGGGVIVFGGSLTMSESTLYGNTNFGLAVTTAGGTDRVENSTITATAPSAAASIYRGGLIWVPATASGLSVSGTIDAGNRVASCAGSVTDLGGNVDSGTSCGFHSAISRSGAAAHLGKLASNGGPTATVLPGVSSAARNLIPFGKAGCVAGATDQRGAPRRAPADGRCDAGSVEAKVVNPTLKARIPSAPRKSHGHYLGAVTVKFTCTLGSAPLTARCPKPTHVRRNGTHHLTRTIHAVDGGRASVHLTIKIHKPKHHRKHHHKRG